MAGIDNDQQGGPDIKDNLGTGASTEPQSPVASETADAVQAVLNPPTEKTMQLAAQSRSYLDRLGASPEFLALVCVMEESKLGLGLHAPSGSLFKVIRIDQYPPTNMFGKGPFVRCLHKLIAQGPSLPEPITVETMIDVDAGSAQVDLEAIEVKDNDYIRYKSYIELGQNPALMGRLVLPEGYEYLHYAWRDKERCIMNTPTGNIYFDDRDPDHPIFHGRPNNTRKFNPASVTPQDIDYALAKLFGVPLLSTETAPPDEVIPETTEVYAVIAEPINEVAKNSLNKPKFVRTKHGIIAYGTDKGIGYKEENEDAVVVNSEQDCFAVIDGMGGEGRGGDASEILAKKLLEGFNANSTFKEMQNQAHLAMKAGGMWNNGACYIAARIVGGELRIGQAGDVKLMVINKEGVIKFATTNENFFGQVTNAVTGQKPGITTLNTVSLAKGDRIVVASDGLFDNITPQEVVTLTYGKTIQEAIRVLNWEAKKKMQDPKTYRAQGEAAKPDNISIVVYDIENLE